MNLNLELVARNGSGRLMSWAIIGTLLTTLTACGSDVTGADTTPPPPAVVAGSLSIEFQTPANNDGAVQFMVTGPAIDSVRAEGYAGFVSNTATSAQLIVTGQVGRGRVARVYVKDISHSGEYQIAVVAAAARSSYALQDLQGYGATLTK